jgi:hypothetical protein
MLVHRLIVRLLSGRSIFAPPVTELMQYSPNEPVVFWHNATVDAEIVLS